MKLKGWVSTLSPEFVEAIEKGQLQIIDCKDKFGEYQLLKGSVQVGHMIVCFK